MTVLNRQIQDLILYSDDDFQIWQFSEEPDSIDQIDYKLIMTA